MESKMLLYIAITLGLVAVGEGIYIGAKAGGKQATEITISTDAPETVAATAGVVEETGEAVNAEPLRELELRAQIAASPVRSLGMEYLVENGANHRTIAALVEYDIGVSGAMVKDGGAFNLQQAQQDVSAALAATPCPTCPVCPAAP
ncbi:MAG TPA: hypothetical protein VI911_07185 [Patescibacteria group bacterium]|nr:hypothetical protein [Patescibacteria group bacterium]